MPYQDPAGDCVAWCWNASAAPTSLTAGSINADVSVNSTAGFSMGRYTGIGGTDRSIEHGLSKTPEILIAETVSPPPATDLIFCLAVNSPICLAKAIEDLLNGGTSFKMPV